MADNNKLELIIEVDPARANAGIKSVNASLTSMEQAAVKGGAAASAGMDQFTASMVKGATAGNLIADAIKKAIDFTKSWTIEAAKMAAHEQRMEASGRALAKAHGIANEQFERAVESVRKIGFHGEDAVHAIDRMIIADLELSKAQGLAKIAKDAAAIENIAAPEALEKILQAIEFGNARALRSAGIRVQFEDAIATKELQLGRTLSENEKVQVRYNAVIEAAAAIQGAHAGAAGEAETQMKALNREVHELKEAVGAEFQGQFKAVVSTFRDLVGWLKDNADLLTKFGQVALWVAGILATYQLAKKIMDLAKSVAALRLASLNPYALLAGGVIAAGAIVYKEYSDMREENQRRMATLKRDHIRQTAFQEGGLAKLRAQGMTDEDIREAITGSREIQPGDIGYKSAIKLKGEPDVEALKLAADIRKKQKENEQAFAERALEARGSGKSGYVKDVADINAEMAKRTRFVDEKGILHAFALTKTAWASVIEEAQAKFAAFKEKVLKDNREVIADYVKAEDEAAERRRQLEAQRFRERLAHDEEIAKRNLEHLANLYQIEEQRAGYTRDRKVRELEGMDAETIQQKRWVEQRKSEIEVEYIEKTNDIRMKLFDMETRREMLEEELTLKRLGYRADEISARLAELETARGEIRAANQEASDEAVTAARENAANRQTAIIRDHYRSVFESLKQQAGGVFDALLSKSQSVWQAIGNSFKTAILTAIKEVVTSRVAAMLMQLFTGTRVSFGGGTGLGGMLGLGAAPLFAAGGSGDGMFGSGPVGGNPLVLSAVGSLAGGAGGGSVVTGGGGGGILSAAGMAGAWKAQLAGYRSILSSLGNIGQRQFVGPLQPGASYNAPGVGGWQGGAMLAGGGILATDGLRRGGWSGVAETTAGGALIGGKFGGPLGAVIGGAIGFAAGIGRLFVKSGEEKVREKIKSIYGVDISDRKILKQIVDIAKQSHGGSLDMAVRSEAVRDIVRLYAQTMGQSTAGLPARMTSGNLVQSGGGLFQSPTYENGQPVFSASRIPQLGGSGGPMINSIVLDSEATVNLISQGGLRAVSSNPRLVARSALRGNQAAATRGGFAANMLAPGVIAR